MKYGLILVVFASAFFLSGCETLQSPQQRRATAARQQATSRMTEEKLYKLQGRIDSMEMEYSRLAQELQQARSEARSANSQVSQLNSKLQNLEAKQAQDLQEVVRRVETLVNKAVASRPAVTPRPSGREHVVQKGHTLSVIAEYYGTTVDAIKKANNLKSDTIRIGQKLIIP